MFSYVSVCSVSQSVCPWGRSPLDLTVQGPPLPPCTLAPNPRVSDMGPPALPPTPASDILGPVQTCGDTEACTVGRRAVRILLECFLFLNVFDTGVRCKRGPLYSSSKQMLNKNIKFTHRIS